MIVQWYSIENIGEVLNWKLNKFSIYLTYCVGIFEVVGSSDNNARSLHCNTVIVMMLTKTTNLNSFKFESIENLVDLGISYDLILNVLESSIVSAERPINKALFSHKKLANVSYHPIMSTAFWESILYHYVGSNILGVIYDIISG